MSHVTFDPDGSSLFAKVPVYWFTVLKGLNINYCMVCAYIREYNPQALASGLSSVHMLNHTLTALLRKHACARGAL